MSDIKQDYIHEFDMAYETFCAGTDPKEHRQAIKTLLSEVGLEDEFDLLLDDDGGVKNFFLMWEQAAKSEENEDEQPNLQEMGHKSKQLYQDGKYAELCSMYGQITLVHLCNFLQLDKRPDFTDLTDHDLFEKSIIPPEIYLQYFLLETPGKSEGFDWSRDEEIVRQNLACMVICFTDINAFVNEDDEDD